MATKRFKLALADCQQAASLQASNPSSKTLIRLSRCHFGLGKPGFALSTIREVLTIEPSNTVARQLEAKILDLEAHLRTFESARLKKDWALARLALDKCFQSIESESGEVPTDWRCWRIELELARGNWDGANTAAK